MSAATRRVKIPAWWKARPGVQYNAAHVNGPMPALRAAVIATSDLGTVRTYRWSVQRLD